MEAVDLTLRILTLGVGTTALVVYFLNRINHRRDAAIVVLGEVQAAQEQLKRVQEHVARFKVDNNADVEIGLIPSQIVLMPTQSWSDYKHLFTRRMDRHVFDSISKFYEITQTYDKSVAYNNGAFAKNEENIRMNIARMSMDKLVETTSEIEDNKTLNDEQRLALMNDYHTRANGIRDFYLQNKAIDYNPRKPMKDAKVDLETLSNIDLSLAILRLKHISWIRP